MLSGEYYHSLDAKGRVFIPAKIKDDLGEEFVIAKCMDPCIAFYPKKTWDEYVSKLNALPEMKAKNIRRFVFSTATEVTLDSQGRVLITQQLREYARLDKDVVIVGTGDRAEVWSLDRYQQYREELDVEEMSRVLTDLGF